MFFRESALARPSYFRGGRVLPAARCVASAGLVFAVPGEGALAFFVFGKSAECVGSRHGELTGDGIDGLRGVMFSPGGSFAVPAMISGTVMIRIRCSSLPSRWLAHGTIPHSRATARMP